jgi:hypothetical protein
MALSPLLFWLLGSVLVYVLGAIALWLLRRVDVGRSVPGLALRQIGRFLYFLGIPYLALGGWPRRPYQGLLSMQDMGLVGLNEQWPVTRWLEAVGSGLGLGSLALLILLLAWVRGARQLHFASRPWWELLVDGLYLEVHWAFYRGAMAVLLGDVYGGVFAGLALIYLEWTLSPFWRQGWQLPRVALGRWLRAALALVISIIFLYTRNLWICLGVHWLIELPLWRLGREQIQGTGPRNAEGHPGGLSTETAQALPESSSDQVTEPSP